MSIFTLIEERKNGQESDSIAVKKTSEKPPHASSDAKISVAVKW